MLTCSSIWLMRFAAVILLFYHVSDLQSSCLTVHMTPGI